RRARTPVNVFVFFQDCKEQIPPPAGWNRDRAFFCWRAFVTQEELQVHIACAHRATESCGVWGCEARFCPNEIEQLRLHRLRQHALSPNREAEPPSKRPKRVLRAITISTTATGPSTSTTATGPSTSTTATGPSTSSTATGPSTSATTSTSRSGDSSEKDPLWSGLDSDLLNWVQECLDSKEADQGDGSGQDKAWSIGSPEPL
ncbi:unnamed protein product, partial [Owenia fusiformis]